MSDRTELIVPGPAAALAGLLGVPAPDLAAGEGLPLLWHWVYLLDRPAQADLGADGHRVRGGLFTPPPGHRRMWAGGQVSATGPLRVGSSATRRSCVLSVQEKAGRSGPLTFVAVQHQILQAGQLVIDERQDLVYREAVPPVVDPPGAVVPAADGEWAVDVSPTLLFRFSALTYNAHRIHYDRDYARDVEGYPGLLVHGPLQALAMAEAARARGVGSGAGLVFEYRLTAPLFDFQGMVVTAVAGQGVATTTVRDRYGRQTATGTLRSLPIRRRPGGPGYRGRSAQRGRLPCGFRAGNYRVTPIYRFDPGHRGGYPGRGAIYSGFLASATYDHRAARVRDGQRITTLVRASAGSTGWSRRDR
jgi:3-methylfumaryl-CoA hydratase